MKEWSWFETSYRQPPKRPRLKMSRCSSCSCSAMWVTLVVGDDWWHLYLPMVERQLLALLRCAQPAKQLPVAANFFFCKL